MVYFFDRKPTLVDIKSQGSKGGSDHFRNSGLQVGQVIPGICHPGVGQTIPGILIGGSNDFRNIQVLVF